MSEARYLVGDVFDRMAELPDASVDLIVTSPPFLALRSYLPADHEHKHREIGSEATPAAFLSTLLALTREWRRLLAPHGSLCVELGDTYSGTQPTVLGEFTDEWAAKYNKRSQVRANGLIGEHRRVGPGWPLAKSLCMLPTLYPASLAYGRNLLDPDEQIDPWRVRNLIVWHRPNPPVGALGDKVRPSTSYITTACVSGSRWFDLDAERTAHARDYSKEKPGGQTEWNRNGMVEWNRTVVADPAGAPPLDCWFQPPAELDSVSPDVWTIPTAPYQGSHYATFPPALPRKLINLMCPRQVCTTCGEPRRRIVEHLGEERRPNPPTRAEFTRALTAAMQRVGLTHHDVAARLGVDEAMIRHYLGKTGVVNHQLPSIEAWRELSEILPFDDATCEAMSTTPAAYETPDRGNRQIVGRLSGGAQNGDKPKVVPVGWSDCDCPGRPCDCDGDADNGHRYWCAGRSESKHRRGVVLDPFAGSGTTLMAASELGRDSIGIDIDERNLELARQRCGMFLTEETIS